jgi:hypothetical protein
MPVAESRLPTALTDRAAADLAYIRKTMAHAASFTALSGVGFVVVGLGALVTGLAAQALFPAGARLAPWFIDAAVSVGIGLAFTSRKARDAGQSLLSGPFRRFLLGFAPAVATGAVLTLMFLRSGNLRDLPALWLLCYGTGLISGGAFSVRIIPAMGASFMLAGVLAAVVAPVYSDWVMMLGFGGLHLVYGAEIARRHGG